MRRLNVMMTMALIVTALFTACPATETRAFCEQFAQQQCGFAYQCCQGVEIDQIVGGGPAHTTEAECVEGITRLFCESTAVLEDAERAGRIEFNTESTGACISALSEARSTCDGQAFVEALQFSGECALTAANLVTPLVDDGDACFADFECTDGGACVAPENEDPDEFVITAEGSCEAPPGAGENCLNVCAEGLFCDFNGGTCRAQVDRGDACVFNNECQPGDQCVNNVCSEPPPVVVEICERE